MSPTPPVPVPLAPETLRDRFAMMALIGLLTRGESPLDESLFSRRAYQMADACMQMRAEVAP